MVPRSSQPPDRDVDLADRLHSAAIHLLRRLRVEDEASGLSGPRLSALSVIVFGGPVTIGALAKAEQVRPPTISRMVKEMESAGLVNRSTDPDDERVQRVTATARGRRVLEEGRHRRVAALADDLGALAAAERETLSRAADLLARLVQPR